MILTGGELIFSGGRPSEQWPLPRASCLGLRPEAAEVASPTCLRPNVHRPAKGTALLKSQQQDLHCFSRSFLCGLKFTGYWEGKPENMEEKMNTNSSVTS